MQGELKLFHAVLILLLFFAHDGDCTLSRRNCSEISCLERNGIISVGTKHAFESCVLSSVCYLDFSRNDFVSKLSKITFQLEVTPQSQKPIISGHFLNVWKFLTDNIWIFFSKILTLFMSPNGFSPTILKSRQLGKFDSTIRLVWFFNSWNEGIWHDTEVLLAESERDAFIIFRGTESAADHVTNSQTMERVQHGKMFHRNVVGSMHRGMLNAYSRVTNGEIRWLQNELGNHTHPTAFGPIIAHTVSAFCPNTTAATNPTDNLSPTCKVRNTSLSKLLKESALAALRSGKNLVITGHSLGGALATIFSLDLITSNCKHRSCEEESTENDSSRLSALFDVATKLWQKLTLGYLRKDRQSDQGRRQYKSKIKHRNVVDNIFLYTFGEPDFADDSFWSSIQLHYSHVRDFVASRYVKFVGVSAEPNCEPDIVPSIVTQMNEWFGETIMGKTSVKEFLQSLKKQSKLFSFRQFTRTVSSVISQLSPSVGHSKAGYQVGPLSPFAQYSRAAGQVSAENAVGVDNGDKYGHTTRCKLAPELMSSSRSDSLEQTISSEEGADVDESSKSVILAYTRLQSQSQSQSQSQAQVQAQAQVKTNGQKVTANDADKHQHKLEYSQQQTPINKNEQSDKNLHTNVVDEIQSSPYDTHDSFSRSQEASDGVFIKDRIAFPVTVTVCSGTATTAIDAHGLTHYLLGLIMMVEDRIVGMPSVTGFDNPSTSTFPPRFFPASAPPTTAPPTTASTTVTKSERASSETCPGAPAALIPISPSATCSTICSASSDVSASASTSLSKETVLNISATQPKNKNSHHHQVSSCPSEHPSTVCHYAGWWAAQYICEHAKCAAVFLSTTAVALTAPAATAPAAPASTSVVAPVSTAIAAPAPTAIAIAPSSSSHSPAPSNSIAGVDGKVEKTIGDQGTLRGGSSSESNGEEQSSGKRSNEKQQKKAKDEKEIKKTKLIEENNAQRKTHNGQQKQQVRANQPSAYFQLWLDLPWDIAEKLDMLAYAVP